MLNENNRSSDRILTERILDDPDMILKIENPSLKQQMAAVQKKPELIAACGRKGAACGGYRLPGKHPACRYSRTCRLLHGRGTDAQGGTSSRAGCPECGKGADTADEEG